MAQPAHADFAGLHVLVLDEDGAAYLSLKRQLSGLGVGAVTRAQSPEEALKVFRTSKIDALVTELYLPFIKYLRTSPKTPNREVPIIVSSGCQHVRMIRAARDAGIDAYVSRATTPAQLGRYLRDALRRDRRFIASRAYYGPDRRHHDSIDFHGDERRGMAGIRTRLAKLDRHYQGARVA